MHIYLMTNPDKQTSEAFSTLSAAVNAAVEEMLEYGGEEVPRIRALVCAEDFEREGVMTKTEYMENPKGWFWVGPYFIERLTVQGRASV